MPTEFLPHFVRNVFLPNEGLRMVNKNMKKARKIVEIKYSPKLPPKIL